MIEFDVQAMSCGHCASTITKTIQALDPNARVEVNLDSKKVMVETGENRATLAAALTEAGYPPSADRAKE